MFEIEITKMNKKKPPRTLYCSTKKKKATDGQNLSDRKMKKSNSNQIVSLNKLPFSHSPSFNTG